MNAIIYVPVMVLTIGVEIYVLYTAQVDKLSNLL